MHGETYLLARRILAVSFLVFMWSGSVALGNTLQSSDGEAYIIGSADTARIKSPVNGVESPAHDLGYYEESTPSYAPASVDENRDLKWYTMLTKIPDDWVLFGKSTFRAENLPTIGGVIGLTGVLYLADNSTYHDMYGYARRSPHLRTLNNSIIDIGDGRYEFGFIGSVALTGFISGDSRLLRTASEMTEAILSTGVVVQVIKHVSGRESPVAATSRRGTIRLFPSLYSYQHNQPKYYSFPSGHLATTAASLTVLNDNFPEQTWLQPLSYVTLGAVGASLVSKGMHWYSDLPLGLALGYSFGSIAARPSSFESETKDPLGGGKPLELSFEPRAISGGGGINIALHF